MGWFKFFILVLVVVVGLVVYDNPDNIKKVKDMVPDFIDKYISKTPDDSDDGSLVDNDSPAEEDVVQIFYGKPQRLVDCKLDTDCFSVSGCDDSCLCDVVKGECYKLE